MKPLKDIGHTLFMSPTRMEKAHAYVQAGERMLPSDIPIHFYSDQERRELVREVIKKFEAFKWGSLNEAKAKSYGTDLIEEFLKSEGL